METKLSFQIKLQHIHKQYVVHNKSLTALEDVNLNIKAGESIAITGESGSGKTTLLNILGLLDKPTSGSYQFLQQETTVFSEIEQARFRNKHIGFIFQSYYLLPHYTVLENVMLPLAYQFPKSTHGNSDAMQLLEKVGLTPYAQHFPNQLSGGQQQRVSIARAMINRPNLILADEPTAALDKKNREIILNLLLDYQTESGCALILITHDLESAAICQQHFRLVKGVLT